MCFSSNYTDMKSAFKDYMFHYFSEVEGREGFAYDKSKTFVEKEKKVNDAMKREISKLSGVAFDDNTTISKEMWATHPLLNWASFAVVNSLIDMVVPDVLDKSIGIYTEQRYGNMGDSFSFTVEPNDLFYVSKAGRNQRTIEFQRQFEGQVTVVPENREISVQTNLYRTMCGLDSIAKFASKAILSIEAQITKEVYKAFDTAMESLPTGTLDNQLKVEGYTQSSAVKLAQTVTAFNNNSKAIFLGTQLALQNILPNDANYRYMLDSEYATLGYVKTAFGYDTMVLPQVADWRNPYKLVLNDKKIYVVSPSSQKLIKLCYEGNSMTNSNNAKQSADLTETTTINKSWGIAIATNAIAGVITLS